MGLVVLIICVTIKVRVEVKKVRNKIKEGRSKRKSRVKGEGMI